MDTGEPRKQEEGVYILQLLDYVIDMLVLRARHIVEIDVEM